VIPKTFSNARSHDPNHGFATSNRTRVRRGSRPASIGSAAAEASAYSSSRSGARSSRAWSRGEAFRATLSRPARTELHATAP